MRFVRILLVIVAVVCIGVALSYPIRYYLAQKSNNTDMEQLASMRSRVLEEEEAGKAGAPQSDPEGAENEAEAKDSEPATEAEPAEISEPAAEEEPAGAAEPATEAEPAEAVEPATEAEPAEAVEPATEAEPAEISDPETEAEPAEAVEPVTEAEPSEAVEPAAEAEPAPTDAVTSVPTPEPSPEPTPSPEPDNWWDLTLYDFLRATPTPKPASRRVPKPTPTPLPTPTRDRTSYNGPLPYSMKEKVELDEDAILPELKEIYELNHDLVGWLTIPDTVIDYPVVQPEDSEFYLTHDFYGEENVNGQIILDAPCDPYTPSYNLIISGHHMKNGSMFGNLPEYRTKSYWEKHRFVEFDTLMAKKQYVVLAAFYSADYDENEEGFRYNANIEYKMDARQWLGEIKENQLYDTGIDAEFGDEFITLTTCNRARHRNGRFVVVCRKIREGETFE